MQLQPINPDTSSEIRQEEIRWPEQTPLDSAILKLIVQDVTKAEEWMTTNGTLTELEDADRLIRAKVPMDYWQGTRIPRANLGVPIVLEHADSLLPQLTQELFGDDVPFDCIPWPGQDMAKAQGAGYVLEWELDATGFEQESELGLYDCLLYGTGVWKWGWMVEQNRQRAFGGSKKWGDVVARPFYKRMELRHVFVDPALRVCDWSKAGWVAHRSYMTPIQLDELRLDPSYQNIPSRLVLAALSFGDMESTPIAPIETNLFGTEMPRNLPTTVDPLGKPMEVIEYTTPEWIYTTLNRKVIIRKQKNIWGVIPYVSCPFKLIPGSPYGLGLSHLIGGEQKLQQGLINLYLDNKSLQLNGMFIRRRGSNVPAQQLRMRPGGIIDVDDVTQGVTSVVIPDVGQDIFQVLAASDARSQRRTAANEFVTQGGLSQASSITRTAAGVNAIQSAAGARIQKVVERFSNQVFIPTLEAFHYMNKELDSKIVKSILSHRLKKAWNGDPREITGQSLDFKIGAASKLRRRAAMSSTLPQLVAYLEQQGESLKAQQKTIKHENVLALMMESTGWGKYEDSLIRDMTEEEVQQMMSENPMALKQQEIEWQRQLKGVETEAKLKQIEAENMGRAGRDVIKAGLDMAKEKEGSETAETANLASQLMGGMMGGAGGGM